MASFITTQRMELDWKSQVYVSVEMRSDRSCGLRRALKVTRIINVVRFDPLGRAQGRPDRITLAEII